MKDFIEQSFDNHLNTVASTRNLKQQILDVANICAHSLATGHKIIFCGNGGSASDAQHLAGELMGRLKGNRRPLSALALTADTAVITCIGNDYGYEDVFARQVGGIGREGDIVVGISTSGNSRNIIRAIEVANQLDITTIGLLGGEGGELIKHCKHFICIDSTKDTARIQEAHILIGHIICGLIEKYLDLEEKV